MRVKHRDSTRWDPCYAEPDGFVFRLYYLNGDESHNYILLDEDWAVYFYVTLDELRELRRAKQNNDYEALAMLQLRVG